MGVTHSIKSTALRLSLQASETVLAIKSGLYTNRRCVARAGTTYCFDVKDPSAIDEIEGLVEHGVEGSLIRKLLVRAEPTHGRLMLAT